MKKAICVLFSLLLLCAFALPVSAAEEALVYTADSVFSVGGTVRVDEVKTRQKIMEIGKNAEEYNAALEGNMQYYWFRNDTYYKDGPSLTLTEEDKGCVIFCKVYLFSDADRTMQCGAYDGAKFTVPTPSVNATLPEITTEKLPEGTVGVAYNLKLTCTDPDAAFSLLRSSLPDGLNLTQHGEIEGTPTKAGFWYVVVMVTPEGGADFANTKEFEFTVVEAKKPTPIAPDELPDEKTPPPSVSTETAVDLTEKTEDAKDDVKGDSTTVGTMDQGSEAEEKSLALPWWAVLLIALGALGAGVGITLAIVKKKK